MASFAFMDITKIKTAGQMTSKYIHNTRKIQIDNVIPELSKNNETLVSLPQQAGKELSYNEAFKDRLSTLSYYQNHNIRKNAVLGYEVLMTFSRDANIDIETWKQRNVEWLHKTFDVAPDGRSNVLHAEYHADEVGNVHMHAFVVPIDENGHLNAKRFTDGSRAMSKLQDTYADSVKDLGLKRGVAGSSAKHQDIRKMYANLNNAMILPEIRKGETAEEYKERVGEQVKTAFVRSMRETDDYSIRRRRSGDIQARTEREAIERELVRKSKIADRTLTKVVKEKEAIEQDIVSYEDMARMLLDDIAQTKMELAQMELEKDKAINNENARIFYEDMNLGMEVLQEENPEEAKIMQENFDYLRELAEQRREEMEQEENREEDELDNNML